MQSNLKQKTMAITGWSDSEYKRRYNKFAQQVRNFNRATGAKYSAAQMFYNAQKPQTPSKALAGIMATPATKAHKIGEKGTTARTAQAASQYVTDRYSGLATRSPYVAKQIADMKAGKQSVEAANRNIIGHINRAKLNAKSDPGTYATELYG